MSEPNAPPGPISAIAAALATAEEQATPFKEFLERVPPGVNRSVAITISVEHGYERLSPPEIRLHCDHKDCDGERNFEFIGGDKPQVKHGKWGNYFLNYRCKNCEREQKGFALRIDWPKSEGEFSIRVRKYGEIPEFGVPISDALNKLIENEDRALLAKGYKSENQGLGIAALAYYRRVVENQKNAIFNAIRRVVVAEGADAAQIAEIDLAIQERQFASAVDKLRHGIPKSLRIDGHDPLTLLHDEISTGIHDLSDVECLERAQSIRVVLGDLADRVQQALKDRSAVKGSVSALLQRQRERKNKA